MTDTLITPVLSKSVKDDGRISIKLSGCWTLPYLLATPQVLEQIKQLHKNNQAIQWHWDITEITILDSFAGLLIWKAFGQQQPTLFAGKPEHRKLLERWQQQRLPDVEQQESFLKHLTVTVKKQFTLVKLELMRLFILLGQLVLDAGYLITRPQAIPWTDISNTIYDAGVKALGITALVGFLIGIVLSYLSALQLKMFGAEIYIINILGMSIIRELGPLLAAILVAGRSGSAMTAQIGIMRVTEELDALSAMGISLSLRLILPKVLALTLVMPLLNIWTDAAALIGGILSAQSILDISYLQFINKLPDAIPLANVLIGLAKSAAFGLLIALLACHFGFKIKPNTESLGNETTNSVVAAITVVIMADALFAILFMNIGMPS